MFGDPWTTSGGKALGFHASCRLRLKPIGQIKTKVEGKDQTIGIKTRAIVVKNRMGPPLRQAEFEIYFDSGVDDYGGWLQVMKDRKLITLAGAWYTYTDTVAGTDHKFLSKDWKELLDGNEDLKQQIYDSICNAVVMDYKTDKLGIDDVIISEEPVPGS